VNAISSIPPVIAVTGLSFEARIAAGAGVTVVCSGDPRMLFASLSEAVGRGCSGIISFGTAGGLVSEATAGRWIVATAVISRGERFLTHHPWSQRLRQSLSHALHGDIAGADVPIADPPTKRMLRELSGAVAVDMESHVAASVAAAWGLPFAVCRVIIDAADRALPAAALVAQRRDGTLDINGVIASLVRSPRQVPAIMRTALDARTARAALLRGRRLFGPGLGFPPFGLNAACREQYEPDQPMPAESSMGHPSWDLSK
jgi:adenosylhomocysteine nucleosidase